MIEEIARWAFGVLVWACVIGGVLWLWPWTFTGKPKDRDGGN